MLPEFLFRIHCRLFAVNRESARLRIIETKQEIDNGGFAASSRTDEGNLVALIDVDIEVFDDLAFAIIGEVDVLSLKGINAGGEFLFSFIDILRAGDKVIDTLKGREGVAHFACDVADFVERSHVLVSIA